MHIHSAAKAHARDQALQNYQAPPAKASTGAGRALQVESTGTQLSASQALGTSPLAGPQAQQGETADMLSRHASASSVDVPITEAAAADALTAQASQLILSQPGLAMQAQANRLPQRALGLLDTRAAD